MIILNYGSSRMKNLDLAFAKVNGVKSSYYVSGNTYVFPHVILTDIEINEKMREEISNSLCENGLFSGMEALNVFIDNDTYHRIRYDVSGFLTVLIGSCKKSIMSKINSNGQLVYDYVYTANYPLIAGKAHRIFDIFDDIENWRYQYIKPYLLGMVVADIGFGYGQNTLRLLADGYSVKACEISRFCISQLKQHACPALDIIEYDVNSLAPVECDTMIAIEILEHLPRPEALVEVARKSCKRLIVISPIGHNSDDETHLQHFWKDDLHKLFKDIDHSIYKVGRTEKTNFMVIANFL